MPIKHKVYQAGGMEKAKNNGTIWRANLTPKLEELGYEVINPCIKEHNVFAKYGLTPEELKEMKKSYNIPLYQKLFKDIVDYDLKMIRGCDVVVVYYDESVNMSSGTTSEMTFAHHLGIPVLVVLDTPYYTIPCWTIGCVDKFFDSFKDMIEYMKSSEFKEKYKIK